MSDAGFIVESYRDAPMAARGWFRTRGEAEAYARAFGESGRVAPAAGSPDETRALRERVAELTAKCAGLEEKLVDMTADRDNCQEAAADAQIELEAANSEAKAAEAKATDLAAQYDARTDELVQLREKLVAVQKLVGGVAP